ncbi:MULTISPECIES: MerR family transcriptional regulator [Paenibacillus]|uniref:MerR family transcriptional regulator n=1 Tax=Paenibacillus TaxID=44249 RepID=UPI0022B87842|nr:MerR family transcriptional regulator [Paenibacillus caseinilyticus]MCZ8523410.1 MerR family transcriptional regulator [Paenibacillus caseinilyticus]
MKISELSEKTGVSVRCLRHYEQKGLLTSDRLENRYRHYDGAAVDRIKTIQFYLSLGFTTEQIAGFLNCVLKHQEAFCTEVKPLYEKKIQALTVEIKQLLELKARLEERFSRLESS